jgi:spore coat-associated protein N
MKRAGIMLSRHRYLTLAAVALLVAAGAVAAFSGAAFSYKTANPSNTFTAGILTHSNSANNAAILTVGPALMKPGDTKTGTVTITNTGNLAGVFSVTLTPNSIVESHPNGGVMSDVLTLKIDDITGPGPDVQKYTGLLKNLSNCDLGEFASGAAHTYRFTVTFPASCDNTFQNSSLTCGFDWNEVQVP